MDELEWRKIQTSFATTLERFDAMRPFPIVEKDALWNESPHLTLGHLTACQIAWLPVLQQIDAGAEKARVKTHPNKLYVDLGFGQASWTDLLDRFRGDRKNWSDL